MRAPFTSACAILLLLCGISTSIGTAIAQDNAPGAQDTFQDTNPNSEPSVLRPDTRVSRGFSFRIDAIDPSAAINPAGVSAPGFRGENQLIIYTPAFGERTQTNNAGEEAVVDNQLITQSGAIGNNQVPANGFVISAHGTAAQWLSKFDKPGAIATFDPERKQVIIQFTPASYLYDIDTAIQRAEVRPPANQEAYTRYMGQAKTCRTGFAAAIAGKSEVTHDLIVQAKNCQNDANRAFYNTIVAHPGEFRGAWLRPSSINPDEVRKTVDSLKRTGINQVFLETYYQGRTTYPSDVMAEYGLPTQHTQFKGGDPVKLWVDIAHEQGLKVNLWTEVFFAGNAQESAETYGPILQKYPEWRNIQRPNWNVKTPVISDIEPGHYFLDPANPDVRTFLEKLLLEMVSKYDIDGLNLDYIRYPASAAVSKAYYLGTTWGYTESARRQFQELVQKEREAAWAKNPASAKRKMPAFPSADPKDFALNNPLWPRWVTWRKEQVSSLVKSVSEKAHAMKPNLLVSAVIFPASDPTYAQKLQDYPRWAREGLIQAITPIGLSARPELMYKQAVQLKQQVPVPVYVGIFGMYNRATPVELLEQIDAVHQADMPGIVLFEWTKVTPDYQEALIEGPFRQ